MTKKPQQRTLVTRERILDAARSLIQRLGIDAVTAEAIAIEAGVAKGTVFAHFGDMDGLLSHLLLDRLQDLKNMTEAEKMPPEGFAADPAATLVAGMMALIEVITENQTILRVFMENIGVTKGHCAPEFVQTLNALDARLWDLLRYWHSDETMVPVLRKDRSPEEMVDGLIAFMIHGAILYRSHQIDDLEEIRRRLTRHVEAFLLQQ